MEDDVKQSSTDRYALSQAYRWKAERDKAMQELREIQARLMPDSGGCCEPGTYRCQEQAFTCDSCGHTVFVDKCMVDEISYLRAKGIRTLNCCCGHGGKVEPFIIVNEGDECRMLDLGYERHVNEYGVTYFTPKSACPPKVIAADGEPLREGETVWHVGNGVEFTVIGLPRSGEYQSVKLRLDDGAVTGLDPGQLTHQRPVLDADGVPIHKGETVYGVEDGTEYTVCEAKLPMVTVEYWRSGIAAHGGIAPSLLTHERPEDTWKRLENDANTAACLYFGASFKDCKNCDHKSWKCSYDKARDLVSRAKKLAGVSK